MSSDPTAITDLSQPEDDRDPEIVEAVSRAIRMELARVRTLIPGIVQSFDATTQRATVQAGVQLRLADGSTIAEPIFADVPVAYPGAGGYAIYWPLAVGDEVLVGFAERSIDEWLERGGYNRVVGDPRRFSGQDALVLPGVRSKGNALASAARGTDALTLSSADGATRVEIRDGGVVTIFANEVRLGDDTATFLALATLVSSNFATLVGAFNAHTHVSAAPAVPTSVPVPPLAPFASVAATKAKGT
jgi:hypothetical protein